MAVGDIGAVIDSFEFDTVEASSPKMIHISGDVYAIIFEGTLFEGELRTFTITSAGDISAGIIEAFRTHVTAGRFPDILHVSGTIYVLGYSRYISTLQIGNDGDIAAAYIDTLLLEGVQADYHHIIHISGDVFAIAYTAPAGVGKIQTVSINAAGDISAGPIDTFTFDAGTGNFPRMVNVYGNIYAIAYTGPNDDGWLSTVSIADNGDIGASVIDSLEFDATKGHYPKIVKVSGDFFAIAYTDTGDNGVIITVEIDHSGNITAALVDSYEFESVRALYIDLIHCFDTLYAMAFTGPDDDGWLKTVIISNAGNITPGFLDSFEFDSTFCTQSSLLHLAGDIFAIAYSDTDTDGMLKTVDIEIPTEGIPRHELLMGIG